MTDESSGSSRNREHTKSHLFEMGEDEMSCVYTKEHLCNKTKNMCQIALFLVIIVTETKREE